MMGRSSSALDHKRKSRPACAMSASPPKADMAPLHSITSSAMTNRFWDCESLSLIASNAIRAAPHDPTCNAPCVTIVGLCLLNGQHYA